MISLQHVLPVHTPAITSGSFSSNPGTEVMHWMGLAQTGKVSTTSPTAATSSTLTCEGGGAV